jgi:hypothetical protein
MFVECAFDPDLDVVEIDENRDVETILMRQNVFPGLTAVNANPDLRATAAGVVPAESFAALESSSVR